MELQEKKDLLNQISENLKIPICTKSDNWFIVYFGDILNTDRQGNQYYLLETYLQIPYSFEPILCKLHRGIVNEFESEFGNYSGFVHYSGNRFCYGQSRADDTLTTIRVEGLTEDRFIVMYETFLNYFSHSSHDSSGSYRKLNVSRLNKKSYKVKEYILVENYNIPSKIEVTESFFSTIPDYSKPYLEILHEKFDNNFYFKGETITPKIVKHELIDDKIIEVKNIWVDTELTLNLIKNQKISNKLYEINNKPRVSFGTYFLKSSVSKQRMDGDFYI